MKISEIQIGGFERVLVGIEDSAAYHGIIVVHSTALGPAVGGTRFWHYRNDDEAMHDAMRLARGMTYKTALAGLPFGGGKSVIIGNNQTRDREQLFRAHGRFVESLAGKYITAEDVGTSTVDMEYVRMETRYVGGLQGRSGDPSPVTARGVFRAMQASARHRWGSDNLAGKTAAVQGCGHVGYHLAKELHAAGASLIVTDVDEARIRSAVNDFGALAVQPEKIYSAKADIFAPCALGGVINHDTIPQLQVAMVVGAANNQLLEPRHGDALDQRGILYAPDYAANAGGIINGCIELLGWDPEFTRRQVDNIYNTLLNIFQIAARERVPTHQAADRLAEERLGVSMQSAD